MGRYGTNLGVYFLSLNASVEEHPALLTEAPLNPRRNRDQTAEIFFETFRSPPYFLLHKEYSVCTLQEERPELYWM